MKELEEEIKVLEDKVGELENENSYKGHILNGTRAGIYIGSALGGLAYALDNNPESGNNIIETIKVIGTDISNFGMVGYGIGHATYVLSKVLKAASPYD